MRWFTSIVSLALLLTCIVTAYSNPKSCTGTCTNAHDPSIIRRDSDGKYFRFSTGGKIAIHTAPAITGPWTYIGAMLPSCSSISLSGNCDLWAPSVHKVGSTYYVYYSVSTFGSQNSAIGLATSSTMDAGTWSDVGATGVTSSSGKAYNTIDPALIQVGSDYYLNYGSFWGDLYQVKLSSDAKKGGGASSYQIAYTSSGSHAEEGSYMINYGGYYYLFYSAGSCCGYDTNRPAAGQEYKIKVCRSASATGGFVDKSGLSCTSGGGTVVLESHDKVYGPGGQSLYNDPTYGWVIVYHYVNTDIGYADGQKQFGWNQIVWSGGWPTV